MSPLSSTLASCPIISSVTVGALGSSLFTDGNMIQTTRGAFSFLTRSSGELAAVALEAGLTVRFARVCLEGTLPYARPLEDHALPHVGRILAAAKSLLTSTG